MKDVKENSVQWTDWDSNRECLKYDKVGKHWSATKIITINIYQCIISLPGIHNKILYITPTYQILQAKPVLSPGLKVMFKNW